MSSSSDGALHGVRVLDLSTDFGYASKLFADLGATVVLVEPPGGSRARMRPPLHGDTSLWFAYRNAGKRAVELDPGNATDRAQLRRLLAGADIVFDDRLQTYWHAHGMGWDPMHAAHPDLVWAAITPFGQDGPAATAEGCDLIAMASGGMAWLTGYEDTGPYAGDTGLATTSAAQYAAVMALIAMLGRRNAGGGQFVDVSMQEVVALGTETAPQFLAMKGSMRRRLGERAKQAGIGVYPCADGHVFLYAAESGVGRGWDLLAAWIDEAGIPGSAELRDPRWRDNTFKAEPAQRDHFDEVWRLFAATQTRAALVSEGQRRRIAISPVNAAADIVADPHLRARSFFDARGWPGAPYQLSATPWRAPARDATVDVDIEALCREFEQPRAAPAVLPASGGPAMPLAGLRVVDLTWVGAGPFTTKLLADLGAEVWKIESRSRPDQLRRAEPVAAVGGLDASGYFANRNTNKRSVTLDLKDPADLARVRAMVADADVIANSFSPGVMERLGLAWRDVAPINPAAIYLEMPFGGNDGPYRDYLGYGINIATLVGSYLRHRLPGRLPVGTGTNFPDHLPNPLHACFAVLAAIAWRAHSKRGQSISVAQVESTLAACPDAVLDVAATGHESAPAAYVEPWRSPHGIYQCQGDDRWCAISVADDAAFGRLAAIVGAADLAAFSRSSQRAGVDAWLSAWTRRHDAEDIVQLLRNAGIAAAVVANPDDLLHQDAHLASRGFWQYLAHPVMGRGVYHGVAAHFSGTDTRYRSGAPLLGQHNEDLARMLDATLVRE